MTTQGVTLTGWKAVVALVVVAALVGIRWTTARRALDTQGRQALEEWVALELQRPLLADSTLSMEEQARAILDAGEVRIRSLSARGPLDDLVVRVELEPSPGLPAGTELVRYYRMEYSTLTGWRHRGDAGALTWYLSILP